MTESEHCPTCGLPTDLARLLRDSTIIVEPPEVTDAMRGAARERDADYTKQEIDDPYDGDFCQGF